MHRRTVPRSSSLVVITLLTIMHASNKDDHECAWACAVGVCMYVAMSAHVARASELVVTLSIAVNPWSSVDMQRCVTQHVCAPVHT